MGATVLPDIGAWLVAKRGNRSLVEFANELEISKSSLQRYEAGENKLPATLVVDLWARYPDFPIAGHAKYRAIESAASNLRVSEDRGGYGAAFDAAAYQRSLKVMVTAQDMVKATFAELGLDVALHNDLLQLLVSLALRTAGRDLNPMALDEEVEERFAQHFPNVDAAANEAKTLMRRLGQVLDRAYAFGTPPNSPLSLRF